ncbi:CDP-alcohol phosphatidyltransferase family protein [Mesorhizobium sp. VNQ89]|uniref:CDP-alcohol phosphatidyltransferase family protein n=1 Tax=Mesorhizobium quangtriensis TaxID=3157709 RepID=UPI0032B81234
MTGADDNRRPLASRQTGWAASFTRKLAATDITPNQISIASMVLAALAGAAFWLAGSSDGAGSRAALLIAAAAFCQLRLLCNLFDGMVAIEAGKSAPDGGFWNEFPDRVSDLLIFAGLGYGLGEPALGWAAAALAIFTAYVRELGRACGLPADFSGPMAKPQRMALVTAAALISILEPLWNGRNEILLAALWIVAIGSGVTVLRRSWRIVRALRA